MLIAIFTVASGRITPPPTGPVTLDPEWADREGVIMRYPYGFGTGTFAQIVDALQDYGVVYILVENAAVESDCYNYLASHGVPWENIECIYAQTELNGEWTRDYGPWFVWEEDSSLSIIDMRYFPYEPNNDFIPEFLESYWWMGYYGPDIQQEGGNMMTDGHGTMMMTSVVYRRNPGMTAEEVNQIYREYFGQDTVYIFENFPDDPIGHIDGWAKIMNDTTIMVARLQPNDPNYQLVEDHAAAMAQIPTAYGGTFHIIRCQLPDPWWYTYLNGLLFNGLALVPIYGFDLDDQAIAAYQEALGPDWEVIGINCYWIAQLGGAIHCTTIGVPRHNWDYIVNTNLTFEPQNPPVVIPQTGGSFDFYIEIENLESDSILFDVWIDVTLPNGNNYGPVLQRDRITLAETATISRILEQSVPSSAPPGTYLYNGYVGSFLPLVISAQSSFTFEKLSTGEGELAITEWTLTDWEENAMQEKSQPATPADFTLMQNHPNPFNPATVISFKLPVACFVKLEVFDITGRAVGSAQGRPLRDGWMEAGTHEVTFDGSNLASGVYLYRLEAGDFAQTKKMVIIK